MSRRWPSGASQSQAMKGVRRPVPVPGWGAFELSPLAVANSRMPEHGQDPLVEALQGLIDGLHGRAHQVRRDALSPALELPLVEKSQPRSQIGDDGRCLVHPGREGGSGPRLVVIFHEPGQPASTASAAARPFHVRQPGNTTAPAAVPVLQGRGEKAMAVRTLLDAGD